MSGRGRGCIRGGGELVLAAYYELSATPAYFILLDFEDGRVANIRDFRYVPYIAREAEIEDV